MSNASKLPPLLALTASLVAAAAGADTIYRSTDAQGNVFFSDRPPPPSSGRQTERIAIPPTNIVPSPAPRTIEPAAGPPAAQPSAAGGAADRRAAELAAAREAVSRAEAALAEAQEIRPDDWQPIARGGRFLSQRYFDRVAEAETALETAQEDLARLLRRR